MFVHLFPHWIKVISLLKFVIVLCEKEIWGFWRTELALVPLNPQNLDMCLTRALHRFLHKSFETWRQSFCENVIRSTAFAWTTACSVLQSGRVSATALAPCSLLSEREVIRAYCTKRPTLAVQPDDSLKDERLDNEGLSVLSLLLDTCPLRYRWNPSSPTSPRGPSVMWDV